MAIDVAAVWDSASPEERRALMAADNRNRDARGRTWRYAILTVLSIVPFTGMALCLKTVAGKTTTFSVSFVASVALTGVAGLAIKVRMQRQELKRQRRRADGLEADLAACRGFEVEP